MMNVVDPEQFPTMKFGVGQSVSRKEDPRLVQGAGRYTDDVTLEAQAYATVLRSTISHGVIKSVDTNAALAMPGVLAIYTAKDMQEAGYGNLLCRLPLKSHDGSPLIAPPRPAMASDRVRYVGEVLAMVVAESVTEAHDAGEAIAVDIDPLPAVNDVETAARAEAPQLFEEMADNVALHWRFGDFDACDAAFAQAAHVTRLRLVNNRVVVAAMEPRAANAAYDTETSRFTLHVGCQGVFGMRGGLANDILHVPIEQVRVRADDIGGSFGMKSPIYPEYIPLLHAARALGRPVKWCDERSESFLSDQHGRSSVVEAALALDRDGRFLAVKVVGHGDLGAYLSSFGPSMPTMGIQKNLPGVYRTPIIAIETKCVFTNATPTGAYRGAGRPEANYYMERLVDRAARETNCDPAALRRLNMVPAAAMPFTAASGLEYDSGDFPGMMARGLEVADWDGFADRQAKSEAAGRLRGRGLATYLEVTGPQAKEMGGIRFTADGRVTIVTGTLDYGQGHASTFAQVLVDKLGLPFPQIDLLQGDSDELLAGGGTGGSKSVMASSKAILEAADLVIDKGRALAGHFLEAATADIEFEDGTFRVAGTDRAIGLMDLAGTLRGSAALPAGLPDSLDSALVADTPTSSFPNGCHVAEVEIDPETGATTLASYVVVDDFGTLVNPALVEGQVHGGVVQGLGQALMERTNYDEDGQLLSGSFMDYALPRADDVPDFRFESAPVPATTNPLGVKGCGEAGVTGALPAIMNAVVDALGTRGVEHMDMPATPERIWRALRAAESD
jgi:carbon-monoxide dehydrogenase large subunit